MKKYNVKHLIGGVLFATLVASNASAIPSFARQTGLSCSSCHTMFPELTAVGRNFKLHGYTMGGGDKTLASKLSLMVQIDSTNYNKKNQPGDNEINFAQGSLFFGGKIVDNLGAFAQFTLANKDTGGSSFGADLLDIRYVNTITLGAKELAYGVTVNNNLGVQDLWNTTGSWRYPYAGGLAIGSTLLDPDVAPPLGGISAYALWNNLLYVEVGAYKGSKGTGLMQVFSWNTDAWDPATPIIDTVSPYGRVALEHNFGANYFMLGSFIFQTKVNPDPTVGGTLDKYIDKGLDAEWQYDSGDNFITATVNKIWETQTLNASNNGNKASSDTLNTRVSYYYQRQYGATLNYMQSTNSDIANDATGVTYELDYMATPKIKLSAQYNTYSKFGGTTTNASDQNNIYLNAWLMF